MDIYSSSINLNNYNNQTFDTGNSLGKSEFLKLLVTELKNQNPLEPLKDKDFLAQMAQFSSLEQMQNLNTNVLYLQSVSLLGKTVDYYDSDSQSTNKGVVTSVDLSGKNPIILISDKAVDLIDIKKVYY